MSYTFKELRRRIPFLELGMNQEDAMDLILNYILDLEYQNSRMREVLEEISLPPYKDSDLNSLMKTLNARAKACLEEI